jgi:hypothetical protein
MTPYAHISIPSVLLTKGLLCCASCNPVVDVLVLALPDTGGHGSEQNSRCDMN